MSSKQLFLAVAVIALGVCAAWPFRRERTAPLPLAAIEVQATDLTLHPQGMTLAESPVGDPSPAADLDAYASATAANEYGSPLEPLAARRPELESLGSPPEMPSAFRSLMATSRQRRNRDNYEPRATVTGWNSISSEWERDKATLMAAPREHRIVDGDTLERLAEKYLGSAERAGEIFAANRQLLSDPQILPLGKFIRIPSRAAGLAPVNLSSEATDPASVSQPAGTELVPF